MSRDPFSRLASVRREQPLRAQLGLEMVRVWLVVTVVWLGGSARADPASAIELDPNEPALQLDPILRSEIEGFGARHSELSHPLFRLGPHTRARAQTSLWA